MTSFLALANFEGEIFPSKLVFGEYNKVFNWVLFIGLIYRKYFGFLFCNTFSQPFPIFMAYSCSWRDCALGEVLISLGKLIMNHYFIFWFKWYIFQFNNTLRSKYWNISCKNVNQWRNSAISPLSFDGALVVVILVPWWGWLMKNILFMMYVSVI